jgi:putative peptidoglycan lipid II flippase
LTEKGKILKSASVIALATVISRICGYLRDQRIAVLLGTSPIADAFVLAFRIPNMIRRMTGEGAVGASFIPVFAGYLRGKSGGQSWQFAQRVFWDLAVILAVIGTAGSLFSRQLVGAFTLFGATHFRWDLAVYLNRIIFPCVLFLGLAGLGAAILNSFQEFAVPASMGIVFNLVVIAASFGLVYRPVMKFAPEAYRSPAAALAAAILIGAMLQFGMQVPSLLKRGMSFRPDVNFQDDGVRQVGKLFVPVMVGAGVSQVNFFVDTVFATSSRMPAGSITSLYVADRVMELVLGVYAIALSTAILPRMSHLAADGKYGEMKHTFAFALRVVSFITIPATVGLILLRTPITAVLFQHGAFGERSTMLTAHALLYYSLGLPAFAAIRLILPMFYATKDTLTPTKVGAYVLGFHVGLNAILLFLFSRYLWNAGPALASAASAYLHFVALFFIFRSRFGHLGGTAVARSVGKMTICAAAMAAGCLAMARSLQLDATQHLLVQVASLTSMMGVSTAIYFGVAWLVRCEELPELLLLLKRTEPGAERVMDFEA